MNDEPCKYCQGKGHYQVPQKSATLMLRLICNCPAGDEYREAAREALPEYRADLVRKK